jgi:hypothetical protein
MIPDNVLYTDGREVTVTESTFKVKNTSYQINGITKLGLWTIKPHRWPGVALMLAGITVLVCAYLNLIPQSVSLSMRDGVISGAELGWYAGGLLLIIGIVAIALGKQRYAVRISTAEGEKNAIVSEKREYIAQIVDALNRAFRVENNFHDEAVV